MTFILQEGRNFIKVWDYAARATNPQLNHNSDQYKSDNRFKKLKF